MKLKNVFLVSLISTLVFFSFLASPANAARAWNIHLKGIQRESREASVLILAAISSMFKSLEALEAGFPYRREVLWQDTLKSLEFSEKLFSVMKDKIENGSISIREVPERVRSITEKPFKEFGLRIPQTKRKLVDFAMRQVDEFRRNLSGVDFSSGDRQNRQALRDINNWLWRFMSIGISVSEIAASNRVTR